MNLPLNFIIFIKNDGKTKNEYFSYIKEINKIGIFSELITRLENVI